MGGRRDPPPNVSRFTPQVWSVCAVLAGFFLSHLEPGDTAVVPCIHHEVKPYFQNRGDMLVLWSIALHTYVQQRVDVMFLLFETKDDIFCN